jgi:UDP-glucose 4-epimerase
VLEVIRTAEQVTGKKIAFQVAPRRAGDPPRLVGNAARAKTALGWKQEFGDLRTIIETAWRFEKSRG